MVSAKRQSLCPSVFRQWDARLTAKVANVCCVEWEGGRGGGRKWNEVKTATPSISNNWVDK